MIREGTNLDKLLRKYKHYMDRKYDVFILITGEEGRGKSYFLLAIIEHWYKNIMKQTIKKDCYGVHFKDFIKALESAKQQDIAALDEGGDELDRDDYRNQLNSAFYKMYTIIRGNIVFTIVCLPSFFDFNPRFRKRRVRGVIDISRRVDNECMYCDNFFVEKNCCPKCGCPMYKKGYVIWKYYSRQKLDQVTAKTRHHQIKRLDIVRPTYKGQMSEYQGDLLEDYQKRKDKKMKDSVDSLVKFVDTVENDSKFKCRVCGSTSNKYLATENVIRCNKCGNKWAIQHSNHTTELIDGQVVKKYEMDF